MTLRRAAVRLFESPIPLLLAALLLAAGSSLSAQDRERSRPSDSSDSGRTAMPRSEPSVHSSPSPSPSAPSSSPSGPSSSSADQPSSPRSPRTAVPAGPGDREPHRQRPRDDGRGGRGGHGGTFYDPYWGYYHGPYWGGFWTNFVLGWWWDDYYWYGDPYHYRYPPYYGGREYRGGWRDGEYGALDLDVWPGRTEVYIDGRYYGKVDAYDGFPQYLWLPRGTYDVVFYLEGFKTLARQISIAPGMVIDIGDRLERGESVRPEDLATKSHERRDERQRYEEQRRERIERGEPEDRGGDWRDRDRDRDREAEEESGRSEERGRLVLEIEPDDASVYLDGRFVGTGEELAGMRRGLPLEAGKHHLAVVRPGRTPEERDFEVEAGEEVELSIELEPSSR